MPYFPLQLLTEEVIQDKPVNINLTTKIKTLLDLIDTFAATHTHDGVNSAVVSLAHQVASRSGTFTLAPGSSDADTLVIPDITVMPHQHLVVWPSFALNHPNLPISSALQLRYGVIQPDLRLAPAVMSTDITTVADLRATLTVSAVSTSGGSGASGSVDYQMQLLYMILGA